jgi:predicted nucleic acid-binding protein
LIVAVDASVAIKWLVREEYSDIAERLTTSGLELVAPDIIVLEVTNGLLRAARQNRFDPADLRQAFARLPAFLYRRVPSLDYESVAFNIALQCACPIYDAAYIAIAQATGAPLATADERQIATCLTVGVRVSRLENGFKDLLRS